MSVARIIDANANRAAEALRVMEESARFLLSDAGLTSRLKSARHELRLIVGGFGSVRGDRDVTADVGTGISTGSESVRHDVRDVVMAAARRLTEALRVLEEYGKTVDAAVAQRLEQLRYESYRLESDLLARLAARRPRQWRVCVLLGHADGQGRPFKDVAASILEAEPDCVQLREKDETARVILERAAWLVEHARAGTSIIVNDRPDLALLAGADGVHLGQSDLSCRDARKIVGPDRLIGVSTSCLDEARRAHADGADYCGVGPMFPTTTKEKDVIVGPAYLRAYVDWGALPHLAIGGIGPDNLGALLEAGVRGVAVCRAVCAAPDPGAVVRELSERLMGVGLRT